MTKTPTNILIGILSDLSKKFNLKEKDNVIFKEKNGKLMLEFV